MKKWVIAISGLSLIMLLALRHNVITSPYLKSFVVPLAPTAISASNYNLKLVMLGAMPPVRRPKPVDRVIHGDKTESGPLMRGDIFQEVQRSLVTWNHMNESLMNSSQGLPNAIKAIEEAWVAWNGLMDSLESGSGSVELKEKKQCPRFSNQMIDVLELSYSRTNGYSLQIPCGLIQGSAVTVIGIPDGIGGNFHIDLVGETFPAEPEPPIILHYNVRLLGDTMTKDAVIVQNTWTSVKDWGDEIRCPPPSVPGIERKVDELNQCNKMVGGYNDQNILVNKTIWPSMPGRNSSKAMQSFPFKQGCLSVMTLGVGEEGFQMTVDGKQITSFAYRNNLEPWLVSKVRISGDLKLISVLASGLPSSEKSEPDFDAEAFQAVELRPRQPLDLFVGVFSTANNFKRRMGIRRTWMQYPAIKSGSVAVRFFVGLHKNQRVNEELWTELKTYRDIQLMPFVDYYTLITWKTIAICMFGAQYVSAKYVMKTDDDSFIRVDEILNSLSKQNAEQSMLYGMIDSDSSPDRNTESKWYINFEEWPYNIYPPWAHGPGYVVSHDIAKFVFEKYKKGQLKMFKLEDVAMGIWIDEMKTQGLQVRYVKEERVYHSGCEAGYVVAHYQSPREMLCLWQILQDKNMSLCCSDQ